MTYFLTHVGYAMLVGVIIALVAFATVIMQKHNEEERRKSGQEITGG